MSRLKSELIQQLTTIPGVSHKAWPDRDDGFSTIHYEDKEIGHFHNVNELDLRLGKKLIKQQGLNHDPCSTTHPKRSVNSPFIELRFNTKSDLEPIVHLVRLCVGKSI